MVAGGMPSRRLLSVISNGKERAIIVSHFYQKGPAVQGIVGTLQHTEKKTT
jgi:hypothetical protein